jgi:hypothetical protein
MRLGSARDGSGRAKAQGNRMPKASRTYLSDFMAPADSALQRFVEK